MFMVIILLDKYYFIQKNCSIQTSIY